ncbi:hypothetical protein HGRIS_007242 [Hohenbuehelia grisea]|uniref:PRA1 family protein n=1 Tax=Hohenbuehelia grisea TaxID=104357 RepID=A0ABR3JC27_9AGAR
MEREDSGATIESPFASNLNTPVDGPSISPFDLAFKASVTPPNLCGASTLVPSISVPADQDLCAVDAVQRVPSSLALNLPKVQPRRQASQSNLSQPASPLSLAEDHGEIAACISDCSLPSTSVSVTSSTSHCAHEPDGTSTKTNLQDPRLCITGVSSSSFGISNHAIVESFAQTFSSGHIAATHTAADRAASILLRIVGFLPWCAIVGGCILLAPRHLEYVAFGTGYLKSPRGIARYAHWINHAPSHVGLFFCLLIILVWQHLAVGLLSIAVVLACFTMVWADFDISKDASVSLGDDDQQTLYILGQSLVRGRDLPSMIKNPMGGFMLSAERR